MFFLVCEKLLRYLLGFVFVVDAISGDQNFLGSLVDAFLELSILTDIVLIFISIPRDNFLIKPSVVGRYHQELSLEYRKVPLLDERVLRKPK